MIEDKRNYNLQLLHLQKGDFYLYIVDLRA